MSTEQYDLFKKLTDATYAECTLEQKLGVYIQHHPARIVPFLQELIDLLFTLNPVEEPNNILKKAAYERRHHPDKNA